MIDGARELDKLARLINGGGQEPAWLRRGLAKAVASLQFALVDEDRHPARVPHRNRLLKLRRAAKEISGLLRDKTILNSLNRQKEGFEAVHHVVQSLNELDQFLDAAIAAVPSGQGKRKYYPQDVVSPLRMCSGFVCAAWLMAREKQVPHTSTMAHAACEELWRLAGGGERVHQSGDNDSIKGWREHLLTAKKLMDRNFEFWEYRKLLNPSQSDTD